MENNFLHFDLECVRKRDGHKTHTHTFTLVPFLAWTYTPSYTDGYPFPIMKLHQLVKWHNKLVHFHDCAENNQIWCESISLPITYVSLTSISLSLTHLSPPKACNYPFLCIQAYFLFNELVISFPTNWSFISHDYKRRGCLGLSLSQAGSSSSSCLCLLYFMGR
jgi:hypothetical protein